MINDLVQTSDRGKNMRSHWNINPELSITFPTIVAKNMDHRKDMISHMSFFLVVFHSSLFYLISIVLSTCTFLTLEEVYDIVSNLFCLYPINNGVESRGKKKIKISHNDMKRRGNSVSSKTVGKESEECWNISDNNSRYMGSAGAEGFLPSIC